jgi:hypothetical protein
MLGEAYEHAITLDSHWRECQGGAVAALQRAIWICAESRQQHLGFANQLDSCLGEDAVLLKQESH